ncbi:MAG: hypothetical protein Q4G58_11520 [bacterium]|nr:hypothetical protein [bacterium]
MKKALYCMFATSILVVGTITGTNVNATKHSTPVTNNSYFTNREYNELSSIKLICGSDEYTITSYKDIKEICTLFSSLKLSEYTGEDVMGFTTIQFIKSNGEKCSIGLTTDLIHIDGTCFSIDTDILSKIRTITEQ